MSDGLPDPSKDPISPLLAFICNGAIRCTAGAIQFGIEKAGSLKDLAAAVVDTATRHANALTDFRVTPGGDKEESKSLARSKERSMEVEAPGLSQQAKSAAMSVSRAEALTNDVKDVSLDQAMGKQVVAVAIDKGPQQLAMG